MDVFWAAFGGGAAAGIFSVIAVVLGEYLRWRSVQPKLVVSVTLGRLAGARDIDGQLYPVQVDDSCETTLFGAQNPRLSSATVMSFGLRARHGEKPVIQVTPQFKFPYEIEGGKSLTQWFDTKVLLKSLAETGNKPSDIKYAWFSYSRRKRISREVG